jgi:hypothetical protein
LGSDNTPCAPVYLPHLRWARTKRKAARIYVLVTVSLLAEHPFSLQPLSFYKLLKRGARIIWKTFKIESGLLTFADPVAFHESIEPDFAVPVRARPETEIVRVSANFQQPVKIVKRCLFAGLNQAISSLGLLVLGIAEESAFGGPLSTLSESRHFPRLPLAKPFDEGFVRFATE